MNYHHAVQFVSQWLSGACILVIIHPSQQFNAHIGLPSHYQAPWSLDAVITITKNA
jgi:hypothetical protein